ncbi:MAG: 6-bladed beta-propeller [Ignavibacteriales bacterium]|nr:6-bladed beta-propeller [Ignavibacteriales bacterium]
MRRIVPLLIILFLFACSSDDLKMNHKKFNFSKATFDSIFVKTSQINLKGNLEHSIASIRKICLTKTKIVVLDSRSKNILVFNKDGKFENTIGKKGHAPGEYITPFDIDTNLNNEILVLDVGSQRISKFKEDGSYITAYNVQIGFGVCSDLNGGFYQYNPSESAIAEKNSIKHYNENGIYEKSFCPPFYKIGMIGANITIDNEGNVYVIHSSMYLIKKFSPSGDYIKEFGKIPKFYKPLEVLPGRFANREELDAFTSLTKILVTKSNLVMIELVRSKPRTHWIEIYDTDGNSLIGGIKVDPDLALTAVGRDDSIYFIKNPPEEPSPNSNEVPDYQLVCYKINGK